MACLFVLLIRCSIPGHNSWPEPNSQVDGIFGHERYSCRFLECRKDVREVELTILKNGKSVRQELISAGYALPVERVQYSSWDRNIAFNYKRESQEFRHG